MWLTVCYMVPLLVLFAMVLADADEESGIAAFLILIGLVFVANFIPGLALTSRRFHDIGLPGWLVVLALVGVFIFSLLGWIAHMIVMSLPPKFGENEYGPPVYDDSVADIFS